MGSSSPTDGRALKLPTRKFNSPNRALAVDVGLARASDFHTVNIHQGKTVARLK